MSRCPYCESTRSLLMGQVFCSRHAHADMRALRSGTLYIKTRRLEECTDHISRLSIRLMLNGRQWYKVGSADRVVHRDNFLVIEQGQHYRTAFAGEEDLEMIMVGFRPGLAQEVHRSMSTSHEALLDDPQSGQGISFAEQTYAMDPVVQRLFARLHAMMHAPGDEQRNTDVDAIHDRLMERLIELQAGVRLSTQRLSALRPATRRELWRRLSIARDHVEAHLADDLAVADLARIACLSGHHFKRSFREAFGMTPHRYVQQRRLERARELLRTSSLPAGVVARLVGYADESSFVRLYRSAFDRTPGADRAAD